jgi:hypothetical protein
MTRSHRLPLFVAAAFGLATLGCGGTPTPTSGEPSAPSETGPPLAVVGDTVINAGNVDYAREREFTFTVANHGGTPLELTLVHKSCYCAKVEMPGPIPMLEAGTVVIRWSPIAGSAGAYTLAADVQTNDPRHKTLRFLVNAHVQPLVRIFIEGRESDPEFFGVDFGDKPIEPDEKKTREVTVFSTKLREFRLDPTSTVSGLDIRATPLEPRTKVGDYEATSGYKLEVSTGKGLPLGYVRGDLNLALSQLGDGEPDRTVPLPVYAMVGQGLFTVTPGVLLFRMPNIADGGTARVNLSFINPPAKEELTVEKVEPSFVKVDKPEKGPDGKWRITASIAKDDAEAAKCQADPPMIGQVVLKVAGLDRPVTIQVKWAPLPK